jgi:hypothetical protein
MKHLSEKLFEETKAEIAQMLHLRDYAASMRISQEKLKAAFELHSAIQVALKAFCTLHDMEYRENYTLEEICQTLTK